MTVEPAIIGLVIDKVNDDDLDMLNEIVGKLELAETFEELADIDLLFHQTLMGITGNPLLMEFSKLLKEFFIVTMQNLARRKNDLTMEKYEAALSRSVSEHRKLYEAIKRKDREQAQDLLVKHILWRRTRHD
jgi:DNA-binding FadR family transcriptional regulator